jgi:hypothetical protein
MTEFLPALRLLSTICGRLPGRLGRFESTARCACHRQAIRRRCSPLFRPYSAGPWCPVRHQNVTSRPCRDAHGGLKCRNPATRTGLHVTFSLQSATMVELRRRGGDSNPRYLLRGTTVFESGFVPFCGSRRKTLSLQKRHMEVVAGRASAPAWLQCGCSCGCSRRPPTSRLALFRGPQPCVGLRGGDLGLLHQSLVARHPFGAQ